MFCLILFLYSEDLQERQAKALIGYSCMPIKISFSACVCVCWCPLSWESNILLELDLTGLFNLGAVGGPIRREQDEINRRDSIFQIEPADFSLGENT